MLGNALDNWCCRRDPTQRCPPKSGAAASTLGALLTPALPFAAVPGPDFGTWRLAE
jgi:hypothetical protein